MTVEDFIADAKAKASAVVTFLENFNAAHPEVASAEADALNAGVADLATVATAEVEKAAPPSADGLLDAAINAAETEAQSQIDAITEAKNAKVAALQSAKTGGAQ